MKLIQIKKAKGEDNLRRLFCVINREHIEMTSSDGLLLQAECRRVFTLSFKYIKIY